MFLNLVGTHLLLSDSFMVLLMVTVGQQTSWV